MVSLPLRSSGSIPLSSVVQFSGAGPLDLVDQQRLFRPCPVTGATRLVLLSGMVVPEAVEVPAVCTSTW
jgi:hypothetical protein